MSIKDLYLRERHVEIVKTCKGEDLLKNDRISDLPDDVLVHILSSLTLKEVGSTSVLSKRWRYVWAYVPSLNFDRGDMFFKNLICSATEEEQEEEEFKYFRWVDQVVNSHKAHTIEEFMIRYNLNESRKDNIDTWMTFAMEKRVKRLQLHIGPWGGYYRRVPYTLPSLCLSNTLISLELRGVAVSGEVLEKFLCECQNLESLSVKMSTSLVELKVDGTSLKLKSLKLYHNTLMEHLEVYAPNLISFEYYGEKISWPLIITPKLVQLSIGGNYGHHVKNDFSELVGILSQLEVFKLTSCGRGNKILPRVFPMFPVFRKLKILDMKLDPSFDDELFRLGSFLKACPLLHKFALEFTFPYPVKMTKRTRKFKAFRHPHLKILEVRRFMGREVDIAFILYITKGAASLDKLIVTPDTLLEPLVENILIAEKEAEQLRAIIKPGLELEIRERDPVNFRY